MVNQTVEARYIKKSVLEDLLSGLFDPGYTVKINVPFYVLRNIPRKLTDEVVKTSDRSIHEEGNTTPDEIVIATREADSLGVNSRFQIAAEAVIAQCEAVVAQKAMKKAAKIASMTVEAAKEAGECMASDEFLGFTQAEKGKELEFVLAIEIRG